MPEIHNNYTEIQHAAMDRAVNVTHYTDGTSIVSDSAGYTILDNTHGAFSQRRMKTSDVDTYLQYHLDRSKDGPFADRTPLNEPIEFLEFKIPE